MLLSIIGVALGRVRLEKALLPLTIEDHAVDDDKLDAVDLSRWRTNGALTSATHVDVAAQEGSPTSAPAAGIEVDTLFHSPDQSLIYRRWSMGGRHEQISRIRLERERHYA